MLSSAMSKPFYARVALLGLALFILTALAYVIASLAVGDSEGLIFSVILLVPGFLLVFLVMLGKSWSYLVTALISLVGLFFFLPSVPTGLSSPDSFLDFASSIVGIGGLLLTFLGSLMAFLKLRKGDVSPTGSPGLVRAIQVVIVVMAVLSAGSLALTLASVESVSASDKEGALRITSKKAEWNVETLEGSSSGTVKIVAKNSDPYLHTFTIEDLDIDEKLGPGSEKLIVLESPAAGSYEFICAIAGHESMKGTLTIR